MKTWLVLIAALTMVVIAGAASAQSTLTGTPHDLSQYQTDGPKQICVFCHTPHGSNANVTLAGSAPLWNQDIDSNQTYAVYSSPTFSQTGANSPDLIASDPSALCMSCHDGTLANTSLYNPPNNSAGDTTIGTGINSLISGNSDLGTDLTNDHPINFSYADAYAADGTTELVENPPAGYLINGEMQCSSCHDPHVPGQDATTGTYFMNASMLNSGLCLDCHKK